MGRLALAGMVGVMVVAGGAHAQTAAPKKPAAPGPGTGEDGDFWQKRLSLGVEVGPGGVLAAYTQNPSPNGLLFMSSVRAGLDFVPQWSGILTLRQWWLPGDDHALMLGPGARFEPYDLSFGRVFVDGSLGMVSTRTKWTYGLDVGGGFEWYIPDAPGLALGAYLRFGYVNNPDSETTNDGAAWSLGVSMSYHFGQASEAAAAAGKQKKRGPFRVTITDTDHDGVGDDRDECPNEPQGKHPDQFRVGCPEADADEDGIPDSDDPCPTMAPGDTPDPSRPGCPIIDTDNDGIPDADDACPMKAGPKNADPAHNGCPMKKQGGGPKAGPEETPETPEGLKPTPARKHKMK
jgi:hypothetical protein